MINSITICGLDTIREMKILNSKQINHVISFLNPESFQDFWKFYKYNINIPWDYFSFYDTELRHVDGRKPEREDVLRLITLFKDLISSEKSINILIHCHAGISRSTAATFMLLYLLHGDNKIALDKLLEIRWCAVPNLLMLEYMDELLGTNSADYIYNWKFTTNKSKIILPY